MHQIQCMINQIKQFTYQKVKKLKTFDGDYNKVNLFGSVQDEFETIAGIVEQSGTWEEV